MSELTELRSRDRRLVDNIQTGDTTRAAGDVHALSYLELDQ